MKKPLKAIMEHLEPLSQPVNRPPDMNEKPFEELYTVTYYAPDTLSVV